MSGPYHVDLVRQQTMPYTADAGYRLTVTAQAAQNMSEKIFVFRRTPNGHDIFESICTPTELDTLPVDGPSYSSGQLFRKAEFSRMYVEFEDAETEWIQIFADTIDLVRNLDIIGEFTASADFIIGTSNATHGTDIHVAPPIP